MKDRLTARDWLAQGLGTLATEGAHALKVVPMAAKLDVSRGSFYWHFRDLSDFRAQLLQCWLEETTERVIRTIEAQGDQPHRLRALLAGAFASGGVDRIGSPWAAEDAIRSWASEDEAVAVMVASVDDRRLTYIAELLVAAGVDAETALSRATMLYWAYLGRSRAMSRRFSSIDAAAVADIVRLLEG